MAEHHRAGIAWFGDKATMTVKLLDEMAKSFEGWMSAGLMDHISYYNLDAEATIEDVAQAIINEDEKTIDPDYDFRWQARAWQIVNLDDQSR